MQQFIDRYITFSEVNAEQSVETAVTSVFLGKLLLLIDGFDACALIDAKQFPARSVEEPSAGKVLRGAHDGFIETLVANAALLRRRIRDPQLTLEGHKVSDCSRADVVLCYLENKVDRKLLDEVRQKLAKIDVRSVSMSQESIAEAMMEKKQWWTPFPKVRYTERPDAATACVMEGNIVVLVDNSPAAMILPTHFFDFVQEANDLLFSTPDRNISACAAHCGVSAHNVHYACVVSARQGSLRARRQDLNFLAIESDYSVPLLVQLLLAEFIVDLLKLASLNTPAVFSNSFSMLGALVLGDFAVQAHWLVPEVLAYMAFVAISNFAQPSYELGYAFKLLRMSAAAVCRCAGLGRAWRSAASGSSRCLPRQSQSWGRGISIRSARSTKRRCLRCLSESPSAGTIPEGNKKGTLRKQDAFFLLFHAHRRAARESREGFSIRKCPEPSWRRRPSGSQRCSHRRPGCSPGRSAQQPRRKHHRCSS